MNTLICPACGSENIEGADRCENCMSPLRDLDVPRADAADGLVHSVMTKTLDELGYEKPFIVEASATVFDAVRRMNEAHQTCALIIENQTLAGMLGEGEIAVALSETSNESKLVDDFMLRLPETLTEADTIASALNKMAFDRVRHVPVRSDDGEFCIVSTTEILRHIAGEDW